MDYICVKIWRTQSLCEQTRRWRHLTNLYKVIVPRVHSERRKEVETCLAANNILLEVASWDGTVGHELSCQGDRQLSYGFRPAYVQILCSTYCIYSTVVRICLPWSGPWPGLRCGARQVTRADEKLTSRSSRLTGLTSSTATKVHI